MKRINVYPGVSDPRELVLRFHTEDHLSGQLAISRILRNLPDGYTWVSTTTHRARQRGDGRTPGRRASVSIVLLWKSNEGAQLTPNEGALYFGRVLEPLAEVA